MDVHVKLLVYYVWSDEGHDPLNFVESILFDLRAFKSMFNLC